MKIIHLTLTYKWFEKIKSGEKTKEFRKTTPHWNKKFTPAVKNQLPFNIVVFHKGYSAETISFWIEDIYLSTTEENDLNVLPIWVIKLGDRI